MKMPLRIKARPFVIQLDHKVGKKGLITFNK